MSLVRRRRRPARLATRRRTSPAASSTDWRARCSCMRCGNGWISEGTTVIEASPGSTAVSEAYFAALLGLPFDAVMPSKTSAAKIGLIESQQRPLRGEPATGVRGVRGSRTAGQRDGRALSGPVHQCRARDRLARQQQHRRVDASTRCVPSRTRFRSGSWSQVRWHRRHQCHHRKVTSATGDTATRPVRRRSGELGILSALCTAGRRDVVTGATLRIEGIGRPAGQEPSFLLDVVDRMVTVPIVGVASRRHGMSARCWGVVWGHQRGRTCGERSACWPR